MVHGEWFVDWFDSPYYHLLYHHRNFAEADLFVTNLCTHLQLQPGTKVWDLACGKGRHSIALASKGFSVVGTDLSKSSIQEASLHSSEQLDFLVHDMRQPFKQNYFDAVFNLFTSIGYFKNVQDNAMVFKNVYESLKPNGTFVLDFLNAEKFCEFPAAEYHEKRGDIVFHIKKKVQQDALLKRIEFSDGGKHYFFEEQVSLLRQKDFENFASQAGFNLQEIYGNYHLDGFEAGTSERLILQFKK